MQYQHHLQSTFNFYGEALYNHAVTGNNRLFDHQKEAITKLYEHDFQPHEPALICIPTGCGKSAIAAMAPFAIAAHNTEVRNVLYISPGTDTAKQIIRDFTPTPTGGLDQSVFVKLELVRRDDVKHVIPPPKLRPAKAQWTSDLGQYGIVVTNAQKFSTANRATDYDEDELSPWQMMPCDHFGVIVVDEAHHFPTSFWINVIRHFEGKIVFLTATPFRTDGIPVLTSSVLYYLPRHEAVKRSIIRDVTPLQLPITETYSNDVNFDEKGVTAVEETLRAVVGELKQQDERCGNMFVNQAMVAANNKHDADGMAKWLRANTSLDGKPTTAQSYHYDTSENIRRQFEAGSIRILVMPKNVTAACKFSQFVGRAVRKYRHKATNSTDELAAIYIHHPHFRHGKLIEDYLNDRLVAAAIDEAAQLAEEKQQ